MTTILSPPKENRSSNFGLVETKIEYHQNKKGEKYNFSIKEKSGILHELTAQGITELWRNGT